MNILESLPAPGRRAALPLAILAALALPALAGPAPGPALLVVDMAGDRLLIVDPEAKAVRARVAVGAGPHEVAASGDGRWAFVTNYGTRAEAGSSLSVIDVAAGREARRVSLGAFRRPHGMAVVDGKVYFTAEANRALGRYDPGSDAVDRIVGLGREGTHMIAASPDGATLYTADIGSGSISVVRRDTGRLRHVDVGGQPEGLAVSPDGREVWAGRREGGTLAVIDAAAAKVIAAVESGAGMAARLRFTPDGRRVLVPDPAAGRLIVIDAASRKPEASIAVGDGPIGAISDPSGRLAYVALAGEGKLAIVDLGRLALVGAIETGSISDGMAWAPAPEGP